MNVELLKYMNRQIRVKKDITHQEYNVLGIYWETGELLCSDGFKNYAFHHSEVELVPRTRTLYL